MKTVAGLVFGIFLTLNATAAVRYVDIGSTNPVSPYASWAYAARTIQDAVDVASAGDQVVVNDGTYQSGGRAVQGSAGNRVALTKAVTVTSVNGPAATTIIGDAYPHYMYGCRCAYLVAGATLSGFTLSNGKIGLGPDQANYWGGGVWATAASAVVSNCVITGNSIATAGVGGGVYGGTFVNCIISSNATPRKDTYTPGGGGAESSTLINCLVTGNSSDGYGGGANRCKLINCTVVANYGAAAGGASICDASNSIVYFNTCNSYYGSYSNYDIVPGIVGSFAYSCTAPDPGGVQGI